MPPKMISMLIAATLTLTSACSGPRDLQRTVAFDQTLTKKMLEPGTNQVSGSTLIAGGNQVAMLASGARAIVTCAGDVVRLIPVTDASTQWVKTIYSDDDEAPNWNDSQGLHRFDGGSRLPDGLEPSDPIFVNSLQADCDAEGHFHFKNVGNGTWYLFWEHIWAKPLWRGNGTNRGASIMKKITLRGNENIEQLLAIK